MSKQFSQYTNGNPPAPTDRFLIGRVDGASPSGFSNYTMTWAEILAAVGGSSTSSGTGAVLAMEEVSPEDPTIVPGPVGAQGPRGNDGLTTFATTVSFLSPDDPDEAFPIPGQQGAQGAAGAAGTIGRDGLSIYQEPELPEDPVQIPGRDGRDGTNGINGTIGRDGLTVFLQPDEPEDPQVIPGPKGDTGASGGGGGGLTYTAFTKDLGAGERQGTFDITGLSGLTAGKVVNIVQTMDQISSKGNARDEFEMDPISLTGYVVDAATIRALWSCAGGRNVAVGTYAFAYCVSG